MINFSTLFMNLCIAIYEDNIEEMPTLVQNLNEYLNSDIESDAERLTISDIYSLQINNESFLYLLDNLNLRDELEEKSISFIKTSVLLNRYVEGKLSPTELKDYILNKIEQLNYIKDYDYINLTRLALQLQDFSLIFQIKQIQLNKE